MAPEPDAFRVLQVDRDAHADVIRAAYRALARIYHPDGVAPDVARMIALNRAYAAVRTPEGRASSHVPHARGQAVGPGFPGPDAPQAARAAAPFRTARRAAQDTSSTLSFGRYAGWSISQLARHDPDYLRWLCRHSAGLRFRGEIQQHLGYHTDLERRSNAVA